MDKRVELKKTLKELIEESKTVIVLVSKARKDDILNIGTDYQKWYTKALKIVKVLAPDRLEEFISYYRIDTKRKRIDVGNYVIQDFIMGIGPSTDYSGKPLWDMFNVIAIRISNQMQILVSLETRIDSVLADIQGSLSTELQEKELVTANELIKINVRAAGSLAGVILENHLQVVMQNHNITIPKNNPNIKDMNEALKKNNIYDLPTWRKVQYLYDIRTLCSHKKNREPTKDEVEDLISGVNKIIKEVF